MSFKDTYCDKLLLASGFTDVADHLRINNEIEDPNLRTECYLVTVTSRKTDREITKFRNHVYDELDKGEQLDCVMEYHEKCNKVHAHGYLYSNQDHSAGDHITMGELNIHVAGSIRFLSKEDVLKWNKYCKKDCQYTLERNNLNKTGVYARFRAYGKRTRFMED